jgi:hypothetical protein
VEPVTYSVDAELGSQCVSTQILGYFWVHWSTNLSESRYSVLLAHLKHNASTSCHLLTDMYVLGDDTTVNFEEFLSRRSI